MRSNAGVVMLVRCGDLVGHTQLEPPAHDQKEWSGLCRERPGVPQAGAAEGFLCRKVGDGCGLGGLWIQVVYVLSA